MSVGDTPRGSTPVGRFHGHAVVRAAFVLALFGWGVGFYGPPIFLHAVMSRTGWALPLVSAAVTCHFLLGAAVVAGLPRLHAHFGLTGTTVGGALALALGVLGWALAREPWQLFVAATLSGGGWVTMGAAGINAMVSPWFDRTRPRALSRAYNGASVGGVVFSPLWVALIGGLGFAGAAVSVGGVMLVVVAWLVVRVLAGTPAQRGQQPDGDVPLHSAEPALSRGAAGSASVGVQAATAVAAVGQAVPLPGGALWRDARFLTLAAAMALGLFAQIGLIAHLYTLMVPALGVQAAGLAMGFATACAVGGRSVAARYAGQGNRRLVACASYGVQIVGALVLMSASEAQTGLILVGVALFGAGIGNATSLPPLVAQAEFAPRDVPRVVALIVAMAQALYAFAPAAFALVLALGSAAPRIGEGSLPLFVAAAGVQGLAILCLLAGKKRKVATPSTRITGVAS